MIGIIRWVLHWWSSVGVEVVPPTEMYLGTVQSPAATGSVIGPADSGAVMGPLAYGTVKAAGDIAP